MAATAGTELGSFCNKCPGWLRLAAERSHAGTDLDAAQVDDLASQCIAEAENQLANVACSLSTSILEADKSTHVRLTMITSISGINALAPKKALEFGSSNITLIYGQNGSGKSGYVRLLKHLCGARSPGPLHADIYARPTSQRGCTVAFEVAGAAKQSEWVVGQDAIPELCGVDIFDCEAAHAYVNTECEVAYEPPVLSHLSELAVVCEKVSAVLDSRIKSDKSALPQLPTEYEETIVGKWYRALSNTTPAAEIASHCAWTARDEDALRALKARVGEQNPLRQAASLQEQASHARKLAGELERLRYAVGDLACTNIDELRMKRDVAAETARVAADRAFAETPLQGVGEDVWSELWAAARKYSETYAYQGKNYPETGPGARCVLCQQELGPDGVRRLQSFDEFVKGEVQKQANDALTAYDSAIKALPLALSEDGVLAQLGAAHVSADEVRDVVTKEARLLGSRRDAIATAVPAANRPQISNGSEVAAHLAKHITDLESAAAQFDADANDPNRPELTRQLSELQAGQWVAQQVDAVNKEVARKVRVAGMEKAKKLAATGALSRKKGELAEALVSGTFQRRFRKELERLNGDRIRVSLDKTRVARGRALHQINLSVRTKVSAMEILSEGERRVIGLAAFLADAEGRPTATPFIFDDPISSLDQEFEEAVVARLVEVAKSRQVLVFTHRLSVVVLLQDACKKVHQDLATICIRSEPWGTGEPGDTPLDGKAPDSAVRALRDKRLSRAAKTLKESGNEEYSVLAKSICSDFRILLERIIETYLLNDVVQRFRRAVVTKDKLTPLTKIVQTDVDLLDELMTKYSVYEHSQPSETPVRVPQPDELKQDMDRVDAWCREFKSR